MSAHIQLVTGKSHVLAEFTFWPLGTVISFGTEQSSDVLTPIHQWSQYRFDYPGSVDLDLSLNPVESEYPVDFRSADQVKAAASKGEDPSIPRISEEKLKEMSDKAVLISGEAGKDSWIYSGHPNTVHKIDRTAGSRN